MLRLNLFIPLVVGCLLAAAGAAAAQAYTLSYAAGSDGILEIETGGTETSRDASYQVTIVTDDPVPNIKITAVPNDGYRFVKWDDGNDSPVRNVEFDAELKSGKAFAASFVKTYTLTYAAGPNGKVRAGENAAAVDSYDTTVNSNTPGPAVTAVPNTGYHFVKWSDGSTEPEHIVESVTSDKEFTAAFEINTYTLTYTAESGGKLQVGGSDAESPYSVSRTHGSNGPTVTAVPNSGYRFVEWSDRKTATARTDEAVGNVSFNAAFAVIATIKINSFDDLKKIGVNATYPLDGSYELTADIDASASRDGGAGFKPVGYAYFNGSVLQTNLAFSGKFYGNGKAIRGLYINRPASDSGTGLFGYARNAEIKNVAVVEASVTGGDYVGALIGRAYGSTVSGCYTSGSVLGDSIAGGLVGGIDEAAGTVTASYSLAAVSGRTVLGGLVGSNGMSSKIAKCYSAGTVNGSGNIVGGLVGFNDYQIEDCYSTAAVKGKSIVGGFAGESYYNKMNVYPGGYNTIAQCYSAGSVSGESPVGGFAGNNDTSSIIRFCSWDRLVSGQSGAGAGAGSSVTGKSAAEMSAEGWDRFGASWAVSNSYPYLISLPADTAVFTVVTPGSGVVAGRVSGKFELLQIVNRGVGGAPVAASVRYYKDWDMTDSVRVGDSLIGWYFGGSKIVSGVNGGGKFNAKVSGDTLALSELGGNVDIEARFALKKYTVTYISRIRADGSYVDGAGGKFDVKSGGSGTAGSVSVTMDYGTVVRAEAVPDSGYRFRRWGNNPDDSAAAREDTVKGDATFYAMFAATVSVLTPGRKVPQIKFEEEAVVLPPAAVTAGEFTAGPNPLLKQSGMINFYRVGKQVASCELRIYDITGNIINKIKIKDNALNTYAKRIVGSWDLRDSKGRPVSEGTYLLKGTLNTRSGEKEKVSIIIGVR